MSVKYLKVSIALCVLSPCRADASLHKLVNWGSCKSLSRHIGAAIENFCLQQNLKIKVGEFRLDLSFKYLQKGSIFSLTSSSSRPSFIAANGEKFSDGHDDTHTYNSNPDLYSLIYMINENTSFLTM